MRRECWKYCNFPLSFSCCNISWCLLCPANLRTRKNDYFLRQQQTISTNLKRKEWFSSLTGTNLRIRPWTFFTEIFFVCDKMCLKPNIQASSHTTFEDNIVQVLNWSNPLVLSSKDEKKLGRETIFSFNTINNKILVHLMMTDDTWWRTVIANLAIITHDGDI